MGHPTRVGRGGAAGYSRRTRRAPNPSILPPPSVCFERRFEPAENRSREGVAPNAGVLDGRFSTSSKLLEPNGWEGEAVSAVNPEPVIPAQAGIHGCGTVAAPSLAPVTMNPDLRRDDGSGRLTLAKVRRTAPNPSPQRRLGSLSAPAVRPHPPPEGRPLRQEWINFHQPTQHRCHMRRSSSHLKAPRTTRQHPCRHRRTW